MNGKVIPVRVQATIVLMKEALEYWWKTKLIFYVHRILLLKAIKQNTIPNVKRGFTDHAMYSTSSMLRTIELIAGIAPMSQYDAAAAPMWRCFKPAPNTKQYKVKLAIVDLNDKNEKVNSLSMRSEKLDFGKEDMGPGMLFSQIIWKAVKANTAKCRPHDVVHL